MFGEFPAITFEKMLWLKAGDPIKILQAVNPVAEAKCCGEGSGDSLQCFFVMKQSIEGKIS